MKQSGLPEPQQKNVLLPHQNQQVPETGFSCLAPDWSGHLQLSNGARSPPRTRPLASEKIRAHSMIPPLPPTGEGRRFWCRTVGADRSSCWFRMFFCSPEGGTSDWINVLFLFPNWRSTEPLRPTMVPILDPIRINDTFLFLRSVWDEGVTDYLPD